MSRKKFSVELLISVELIKGGYLLTYPVVSYVNDDLSRFGLSLIAAEPEYRTEKEIVTTGRKLNQRLKEIIADLEAPPPEQPELIPPTEPIGLPTT